MRIIRLLSFALMPLAVLAGGAVKAQDFSAEDRARVEARIAVLDAALSAGDHGAALDIVPPRLIRTLAEQVGASEAELREVIKSTIRSQLEGVAIIDYGMDLAAAEPVLTPDGSRTYLLIPTWTVMEAEGSGRIRTRNHTLALEDEGDWRLIRIDSPAQVAVIRQVWPEFAAVDFPEGTTEAVD